MSHIEHMQLMPAVSVQGAFTGWPRSLEIRENRENGQNKFPAGKNQGISNFKKNRELSGNFTIVKKRNVSTGSFSS